MKAYVDGHTTAKHLSSLSIEVGKFIESTGYQAGSSGWRIDGNGDLEVNAGVFRGELAAATGTFGGSLTAASLIIDSGSINLNATLPIINASDSLVIGSDGTLTLSGNNEVLMLAANNIHITPGSGDVLELGNASSELSFYGAGPAPRPMITGSRDGNAALASLLAFLEAMGLVINGTTAS